MSLLRRQQGFTLAEMAVALGVTGLVLVMATGALFEAWGVERNQHEDVVATLQLRNALRHLATDAFSAQSTDLADGAPLASSVSLGWTDTGGVSHSASYSQQGTQLIRTLDGTSVVVARGVTSVAFSRSGDTVFVTLEVTGAKAETRGLTLRTYMRAVEVSEQ